MWAVHATVNLVLFDPATGGSWSWKRRARDVSTLSTQAVLCNWRRLCHRPQQHPLGSVIALLLCIFFSKNHHFTHKWSFIAGCLGYSPHQLRSRDSTGRSCLRVPCVTSRSWQRSPHTVRCSDLICFQPQCKREFMGYMNLNTDVVKFSFGKGSYMWGQY